jgi:CDP-diacylglycerol--glycerol-3-phosphate 3-phosphatidyltransferase
LRSGAQKPAIGANAKMNQEPAKSARQRSGLLQAVPNLLTLTRLVLGLAFPLIPARWQLPILLIAAATEFLDGPLARHLGVAGDIGRILDPIADKVFVVSVLATLLVEGAVKPWQLVLIMSRDIVVMAGALSIAARRGPAALRVMIPSRLGKAATAAQFLALLVAVATRELDLALFVIVATLSAAAAIDYALRFRSGL